MHWSIQGTCSSTCPHLQGRFTSGEAGLQGFLFPSFSPYFLSPLSFSVSIPIYKEEILKQYFVLNIYILKFSL